MPNRAIDPTGCRCRWARSVGVRVAFLVILAATFSSTFADDTLPPMPPDESLSNELLEMVGDGYRIYETDHFTICYDTTFDILRPLVERLEGTFDAVWLFAVKAELDVHPPKRRLRVLFFNDQDAYARQGEGLGIDPKTVAGFYSQGQDLAVFSNTLTRPKIRAITDEIERLSKRIKDAGARQGNRKGWTSEEREMASQASAFRRVRDQLVKTFNRLVIQHEAAHQVLYNIGVHEPNRADPPWLAEGLACQFEVPQTRRDGKLTTINHMRLADFREALGVERKAKRLSDDAFARAVSCPGWLPLGDLIRFPSRFRAEGACGESRYGQAWALVFYLGRNRQKAFATYISQLSRRAPDRLITPEQEVREFEAALGPVSVLQRQWVAYMLTLRVDWQAAGR